MTKHKNKIIRLELDGERINANKFIRSVDLFFDVIEEISENVTDNQEPVKWFVSVDKGSIYIDFTPEVINGDIRAVEKINDTIDNGFFTLEKKEERPEYFTDNVLNNISKLASIVQPAQKNGLDKIKVWANNNSIELTHHTVANVDKIIGTSYKDYGGLEGKLEMLSERKRPHFVIYDFVTDKPIRCNFLEDLFGVVLSSFGKRVYVYGLIKYRKNGEPITIEVENFRILKNKDELPSAADMLGIYKE